jgi:ribose transport system substrate-binding protein
MQEDAMITRKAVLPSLTLILTAMVLLSCGGGSSHDSEEMYYLVTANSKVPYWETAHDGWRQAASQMKVKVQYVGPDTYDPKAEHEQFQSILKSKPSGILVAVTDAAVLKPDIDAAVAQGIPVITMDSDAPDSKRLTFIGTNNYQAGLMGGKVALKALNGKGTVIFFTMPGQSNLDERLKGYKDAFADKPQIKVGQIVDIKGDPRIAFDKTMELLRTKSPVDAFICLEALACKEVADVLDRTHSEKVLVAMDTDEGTLDWIKKGKIAATIAQKPYTMAFYGLQMLDDAHHKDKKTALAANSATDPFAAMPAFVDTGATLIDKNNLADFIRARDEAKQNK